MNRYALYTVIAWLLSIHCFCQQVVIDAQNPLFKAPLDGGKIRENYDYLENTSSINRNPGPAGEITLAIFHSKSVYPFTVLNQREKFKEGDYFVKTYRKGKQYALTNGFLGSGIVPLFDSSSIIVTAYGITPENKNDFQFRVLSGKTKVLVPWQPIRFFSPVYMYGHFSATGVEYKEMAYLGAFNASVGNDIIVEVKSIKDPESLSAVTAFWAKRSPEVIATFTSGAMKSFFEVYKYQWKYDFQQPRSTYYGDIKTRPPDSLLHLQKTFSSFDRDLFFYLKDKVKSETLVEYNLVHNQKDSSGWRSNNFDPNIIWLQQLKPGDYQLLLRYAFQRQTVSAYTFMIKPAWYQALWFKVLMGTAVMIALAFLIILYINRLQHKKLRAAALQKQRVSTELKSIRSQFNPHFVFNALSSIQGLITKNDTAGAHQYLSEFSTLMRESLKGSDREMISITHETAILQKYLNLEQLRFGFRYNISVDEAIDGNAVEVPALLLQPLVENAVKHGIGALQEKGVLQINFKKENDDLVVTVTDNGKGFDAGAQTGGFGLKLTRDRILLLNKTLPLQQIALSFDKDEMGTTARIYFKNGLL
ncbi:sensor histidine kinase [Niabella drilacis]|uniref:Histidine kinase n=1 Tax=Niabella drilacis (strain DSM 25811 / CCM 8410 / CCUG 62505 / LMG 26954 / E90) TaxID=1285928 RepID=A0A1G6XZN3_NIADE|nr:histidine kinase [Niabella drilacis]SDD82836.1 Histidine kinase [Niabella drilacis]